MWFPASKHGKYRTCGEICAEIRLGTARQKRERNCKTCGEQFLPRAMQLKRGQGLFCSIKCNTHGKAAILTKESRMKGAAAWSAKHAISPIVKSGDLNPCWKGGKEARREAMNAYSRKYLKEWRRENPERVREQGVRRKHRKHGRLPKGTVEKIGTLQRWRCAICATSITEGKFHLDHIVPLARGGKHEKTNVQLLCATCNVRKSAKDPIQYMQERGFLL
jgi:5-methylcytosine-specific restriction endonuclease McrA